MKRTALLFAVAALALASCDKKDAGSTSGSTTASAPSDADLAVPADFADDADKSITKDTYKSELDKLETEIDADAK